MDSSGEEITYGATDSTIAEVEGEKNPAYVADEPPPNESPLMWKGMDPNASGHETLTLAGTNWLLKGPPAIEST